jgi:hypothetical protein
MTGTSAGKASLSERLFALIGFLYVQRIRGFDPPGDPALDHETLQRLKSKLAAAHFYLEWGSGGSTVLADQLNVPTISVESDRYYAVAVRKALTGSCVTLLTPRIGLTGRWGWPVFKRPTSRRSRLWQSYVDAPFKRMSRYPDIILVDGRFRTACALEAARQAKLHKARATLIIDDYIDRPSYRRVERYLGRPELVGRAAMFSIGQQDVPSTKATDPA